MFLKCGDEPIRGYRLKRFVGKGQFGQVWEASTPGGATCALKFLDLSGRQGRKEFRAIQRMKQVRHAHLMPIIALWMLDISGNVLNDEAMGEIGEESSSIHDTLDYSELQGQGEKPAVLVVAQPLGDKTLSDRLDECKLADGAGIPLNELLIYMQETARVLDFLNEPQHDLGDGPSSAIRHCDIKPSNILLLGNSVSITDYGLAQVLVGGQGSSKATGMLGSPAYMSPECIARSPSASSDQYSLAISYFELRTGRLPFVSEELADVMEAHREGKLDLSALDPAEQKVIRRATAVNPFKRYPSNSDMVKALRAATQPEHESVATQRRRSIVMLTVAAIICLSTVLGTYTWMRRQSLQLLQGRIADLEEELHDADGDVGKIAQLADDVVADIHGRFFVPDRLRMRGLVAQVRAHARLRTHSPDTNPDTNIVAILDEVEKYRAAASSTAPGDDFNRTYLALCAAFHQIPKNLDALTRLELLRRQSQEGWKEWSAKYKWESDRLTGAYQRLYQEFRKSVPQQENVRQLVTQIWPDIYRYNVLERCRQTLDRSPTVSDVLASIKDFRDFLSTHWDFLQKSPEAAVQLRDTYLSLEKCVSNGALNEDPAALSVLREFQQAFTSAAEGIALQKLPESDVLAECVLRCAAMTWICADNDLDLDRLEKSIAGMDGLKSNPPALFIAAKLGNSMRGGGWPGMGTGDVAALRTAAAKIQDALAQEEPPAFRNYMAVVSAAVLLKDPSLSRDEELAVLDSLRRVPSGATRPLALRDPELQRVLMLGLQQRGMQAARNLYQNSSSTDVEGDNQTPDDDALSVHRSVLQLAEIYCVELLAQWSQPGVVDEARDGWQTVRLAARIAAGDAPALKAARDDIVAAAGLIEELLDTDMLTLNASRLFAELIEPCFDTSLELVAKNPSDDVKALVARVCYSRGRIIQARPLLVLDDKGNTGRSSKFEIYRSFRQAHELDPEKMEHLHQHCRAITELEFNDESNGDLAVRTKAKLDQLRKVLSITTTNSPIKSGWQGYILVMEGRLAPHSERHKKFEDAITSFTDAIEALKADDRSTSHNELRRQIVTFVLNRSTARVELGFYEQDLAKRRSLYEDAEKDAKLAIENYGATSEPRAHVARGNALEDQAYYLNLSAEKRNELYKLAIKSFERGLPEHFAGHFYAAAPIGWARCNLRFAAHLLRQGALRNSVASEQEILKSLERGIVLLNTVVDSNFSSPFEKSDAWAWISRTRKLQVEYFSSNERKETWRDEAIRALRSAYQLDTDSNNDLRKITFLVDLWELQRPLAETDQAARESGQRTLKILLALLEGQAANESEIRELDENVAHDYYRALMHVVHYYQAIDGERIQELMGKFQPVFTRHPRWELEREYVLIYKVHHVVPGAGVTPTVEQVADVKRSYSDLLSKIDALKSPEDKAALEITITGHRLVWRILELKLYEGLKAHLESQTAQTGDEATRQTRIELLERKIREIRHDWFHSTMLVLDKASEFSQLKTYYVDCQQDLGKHRYSFVECGAILLPFDSPPHIVDVERVAQEFSQLPPDDREKLADKYPYLEADTSEIRAKASGA